MALPSETKTNCNDTMDQPSRLFLLPTELLLDISYYLEHIDGLALILSHPALYRELGPVVRPKLADTIEALRKPDQIGTSHSADRLGLIRLLELTWPRMHFCPTCRYLHDRMLQLPPEQKAVEPADRYVRLGPGSVYGYCAMDLDQMAVQLVLERKRLKAPAGCCRGYLSHSAQKGFNTTEAERLHMTMTASAEFRDAQLIWQVRWDLLWACETDATSVSVGKVVKDLCSPGFAFCSHAVWQSRSSLRDDRLGKFVKASLARSSPQPMKTRLPPNQDPTVFVCNLCATAVEVRYRESKHPYVSTQQITFQVWKNFGDGTPEADIWLSRHFGTRAVQADLDPYGDDPLSLGQKKEQCQGPRKAVAGIRTIVEATLRELKM